MQVVQILKQILLQEDHGFAHIEEEYLATIDSLNWPDGIALPDKLEDEDTGASFQVGYGETRASYLWEYSWMKEWLDTYNTSRASRKSIRRIGKSLRHAIYGNRPGVMTQLVIICAKIDKAKIR